MLGFCFLFPNNLIGYTMMLKIIVYFVPHLEGGLSKFANELHLPSLRYNNWLKSGQIWWNICRFLNLYHPVLLNTSISQYLWGWSWRSNWDATPAGIQMKNALQSLITIMLTTLYSSFFLPACRKWNYQEVGGVRKDIQLWDVRAIYQQQVRQSYCVYCISTK